MLDRITDEDIERIVNSSAMADKLKQFIDEKFGEQRHQIERLEDRMASVELRLDRMDKKIDVLLSRVQNYETTIDATARKIGKSIEQRVVKALDDGFDKLGAKLRNDLGINPRRPA